MIAIVDYGAGNLASVKKTLDSLGQKCEITPDPAQVAAASKIVLPGVGHFAATASLARSGLRDAISDAIARGVPFLGICVGMQWMFEGSEESPQTQGLGLFSGGCERFPASVKSPHVGWNDVQISTSSRLFPSSRLFQGLRGCPFFYFTHSFRAPVNDATVACCQYGGPFAAAVEKDQIFGVQFHPEKSGEAGLALLKNFCEL